ncbi:serine hydrolase [Sphingobacterium sp.]|uniref:serine hydrolase n=1 Tax=Sphingobacterium sp. TaxID=341027 RepID=UPI0031CFC4C4
MKVFKRFLFTALFYLGISMQIFAQVTALEVDSLMETALSKLDVTGAAIAIVKDGKVVIQKGYGFRDIGTKSQVNEHTNFQIASTSKAFTVAALAILVEEGKIRLEDKVKHHIPEFKMYNDYVTENMNITDLLTHRSGLGLGAGDLMFFPDGGDFGVKDVVRVFQYFKPVSAFRTQFDYDNLLYIVAGEVIHRASGQPFSTFVENRILMPLGMSRSKVDKKAMLKDENTAAPHSLIAKKVKRINFFENSESAAAGGIYSNVADMTQWMSVQLNRGKYGSNLDSTLFSAANSKRMWTIHTPMSAEESKRYKSHFLGYGLGWFLTDNSGCMVVSHSGYVPGMHAEVILVPDLNLGITILNNSDHSGGALNHVVTNAILDKYLGLSELKWVDMGVNFLKQNKDKGDAETEKVWAKTDSLKNQKIDIQKYIGSYSDRWFGEVQVYLKGKELWIRSVRSPKLNGRMYLYDRDIFAIRWDYQDMNCDAFATFTLNKEGKAESIKMKGISPDIDFSFDFQDLDLRRVR